jgi:deoxyguanosine kinase
VVKGFICIEGNIASGKTTLLNLLSERKPINRIYEKIPNVNWLQEYYSNNRSNHLLLELAFLEERYFQIKSEFKKNALNVSDFSFYRSLIIGSKTLTKTEFEIFKKLFSIIEAIVPKPDVIVFINAFPKALISNNIKRGNQFESKITLNYLEKIDKSYQDFLKNSKNMRRIILNMNDKDFVDNQKTQSFILSELIYALDNGEIETIINV